MRIRQMGFSSRLKAHKHLLTLETLKFIVEFLVDGNARLAALRSGIPETYASRHGQWLKKHSMVKAALEVDLEPRDHIRLQQLILEIETKMDECRRILNIDQDVG